MRKEEKTREELIAEIRELKERCAELEARCSIVATEAVVWKEEILKRLLELLPVGVWITDGKGQIQHANPACRAIWGGTRYVGIDGYGEYKGRRADSEEVVAPEDWAAARAVLKGEIVLNEKIEIECFDGKRKTTLNSAVPIRDSSKNIIGAIAVYQDVTGLDNSEDEQKEMAAELRRTLEKAKVLAGVLHICSNCKKIRDDKGCWNSVERYISAHSQAEFSHAICPDCARKLYSDYYGKN